MKLTTKPCTRPSKRSRPPALANGHGGGREAKTRWARSPWRAMGDGQSARAVEGFELDPSFGEISSLGIGYQI